LAPPFIRHPGSFRDPAGHVFVSEGKIFRTVAPGAAADYEFLRDRGLLTKLADAGKLIPSEEVGPGAFASDIGQFKYLLEHPKIEFISYPYEWPFEALKTAALFHLELQLELLATDVVLVDASAYNIQFVGTKPIFIDLLSLRRYQEGQYWTGQQQFVEQFLGPLLLASLFGVSPNAWYRGTMDGIGIEELNDLIPFVSRFTPLAFPHVTLPVWLQRRTRTRLRSPNPDSLPRLPRSALSALLRRLHRAIGRLHPGKRRSAWGNYRQLDSYSDDDLRLKDGFIEQFVAATKPRLLLDLGADVGKYSQIALGCGARAAVAVEANAAAADAAFTTARDRNLAINVLEMDVANPSPDQGWNGLERQNFRDRIDADAVLALALVHHLSIGKSIPLDDVIDWIMSLAPQGVLEFIAPEDRQIREMLRFRGSAPGYYTREVFLAAIGSRGQVIRLQELAGGNRLLVWYCRTKDAMSSCEKNSQTGIHR
jgi:ribosomal protein L11 methylase PrmA